MVMRNGLGGGCLYFGCSRCHGQMSNFDVVCGVCWCVAVFVIRAIYLVLTVHT